MDRWREEPHQPPRRRLRAAGGGLLCLRRVAPRTGAPAASASTSTGRSAPRSAPTATSTATSAAASTQAAGAGRWSRRSRRPRARCRGGSSTRSSSAAARPSLMPPETVAAVIAAIRGGWTLAPRRRDHARGQPDLGRGRAVPRLPRRRGQPALDGRAGARTTPTCARSGGCTTPPRRVARLRGGAGDLPAGQLRSDLRPPGPDPRRLAGASSAGRWRWRSTTCRSTS